MKNQFLQRFQVSGLWCASCAQALEKKIAQLPGVNQVRVNFVTNSLELVTVDAYRFSDLNRWIAPLGYRLYPLWDKSLHHHFHWWMDQKILLGVTGFFSMWSFVFSLAYYLSDVPILGFLSGGFASLGSLIGLVPFVVMAYHNIRLGTITIDLLIVVSNLMLLGLSWYSLVTGKPFVYFESTIMALVLVLAARFWESYLRDQLQKKLWTPTRPEGTLKVFVGGEWTLSSLDQIRVGRHVLLGRNHGSDQSVIPFDGVIRKLSGSSSVWVDESLFTGEVKPVAKGIGDVLWAGSFILNEVEVELEVLSIFPERRLDQIWLDAQGNVSFDGNESRNFIKTIINRWSQVVLGLGILWIVLSPLIGGGNWQQSLLQTGLFFLMGCPCFLLFVEPVYFSELQDLLKKQFQVDVNISRLKKIKHSLPNCYFFFDKTGTLTELGIKEISVEVKGDQDQRMQLLKDILEIVSIVVNYYPHQKTLALLKQLKSTLPEEKRETQSDQHLVTKIQLLPHYGVAVHTDNHYWWVGRRDDGWDEVSRDGICLLRYRAQEDFHPKAEHLISKLVNLGVKMEVLTGDAHPCSHWIRKVGAKGMPVLSGLSPEQKRDRIQQLSAHGCTVYAGDGINDWLALSVADIGFAISHEAEKLAHHRFLNLAKFSQATFLVPRDRIDLVPSLSHIACEWQVGLEKAFWGGLVYNGLVFLLILQSWLHPLAIVMIMTVGNLWIWWWTQKMAHDFVFQLTAK
ncbi:MAG: HAD family hydrolase [Bdellovibrionaceae bacterium]|nr:HAD family hydrolase [Pseudobdellovibrionaceae bacterium]MDW8190370.1 HAD family hydrolase [Pseudobdellovibrionaceae bacterium]